MIPWVAQVDLGNVTSRASGCPPEALLALDWETSYATDQAKAQEGGWAPPEAFVGGAYVWDGRVRFSTFPKANPGVAIFPTGLLDRVLRGIRNTGGEPRIKDWRRRPLDGVPERTAIPLYDYQKEAAETAYVSGQGVLEMPPRAGKTRTSLELHRMLSLPTVVLAPTTNICKQTYRAAEEFFGKHYAALCVGAHAADEASGKPLVIMTAATAGNLSQRFWDSRQVLMLDEAHHAAARSWRQINSRTEHIFYRYGLSGTFFRSGDDELALHAVLSKVIYTVTTEHLVQRGYLTQANLVYLPVTGPRVSGSGKSFQTGVGRNGLYTHTYRNNLVAWATASLVMRGRRTIILVATKEQGHLVQEALQQYLPGVTPNGRWKMAEFVYSDRPTDVQGVIDAFVEGSFPVLIGTSLIGEGTDLPSADALVYACGGKAEVSHTQAVYRVCTKVQGKDRAIIVDFADRHNDKLLEHSVTRLNTYYGLPTFHTDALQDPSEFPAWLDKTLATPAGVAR